MRFLRFIHSKINMFARDENIPYEIKSFYLVITCAIPVFLLIALIFALFGSNHMLSLFCIVLFFFALLVSTAASESRKQGRYSFIFCVSMNFLFTPIVFFMSEGVYFGMIMIFVLGIILTVLLLGNYRNVYALVVTEFIYDVVLIIYCYFHQDKIYIGRSNMSQETGIAISFFVAAITIIFLFIYQNYINTEMRNIIKRDEDAIRKADNMKGRFLANMTHEIRTPMNAIIGMTNLILKEELSVSSKENVNIIKAESEQLLQIINNILEYSKLDSGRAELINNVYSFREMITGIINDTLKVYNRDDIKLYVFISKDIPDKLFGDEVRIRQVLRYLLLSQLSRTPGGNVNIDISSTYDSENCIAGFNFRIASTGGGLNDNEIAAIYNAYSNYDSRQKTDYNRTGLEISICKKILNMMDGDLTIESIEGIGNAFEFSFKNYVVDIKPIVEYDKKIYVRPLIYLHDKHTEHKWQRIIEELGVSASYVRTPVSFRRTLETQSFTAIYIPDTDYPKLKEYIDAFGCADKVYVLTGELSGIDDFDGCRILRYPFYLFNFVESFDGTYNRDNYKGSGERVVVTYPYARVMCVDDSNVNLAVFDNILREYDIKPTLCNSGKRALEVLSVDEFDLIFIDRKMPEMDGAELAEKIKELPNANSTTPLICATADYGPGIREKLINTGFADYISKPISAQYLEGILSMYLPEELSRVTKIESDKKKKDAKDDGKNKTDPLLFSPENGLRNLGDNQDAYLSVLTSYYDEGVKMIDSVPKYFEDGNLAMYTTNVHALKSSSATVGLTGISPLFKELENAGKTGDVEFIKENSPKTFEYLKSVLDIVKEYLVLKGAYAAEDAADLLLEEERISLDTGDVSELSDCIASMNLKRAEEIIGVLSSHNYGADTNDVIKRIKNAYDNFEYTDILSIVKEIL